MSRSQMLKLQSKSCQARVSRPLSKKEKTKDFFRIVMESGDLFNSKHISLKTVKDIPSKSEVRIIISKKIIPRATSRNRLRRRIREIFEETKPRSLRAIFYTKKESGELSFKELREEVIYLISKAQ